MSTTTKKRKNSAADAKDGDTARDSVRDNADTLRAMTSHSELFGWAKEHGIDNGEDNPALEVCRMPGYRTWREVSLTDLIAAGGGL